MVNRIEVKRRLTVEIFIGVGYVTLFSGHIR